MTVHASIRSMADRMVANQLREAHDSAHFNAGYRAGVEDLVTRLFSAKVLAAVVRSYDGSFEASREDAMGVALADAFGAGEFLIESGPVDASDQESRSQGSGGPATL